MQKSTKTRYDNFIAEYAANNFQNATQAAIKAGYKSTSAVWTAYRLTTINYVKEQIEKKKAEIAAKIELTSDLIIKELQKIALQDCDSFAAQDRKLRALDLLGKVKGIYEADNRQKDAIIPQLTPEELAELKPIAKRLALKIHKVS